MPTDTARRWTSANGNRLPDQGDCLLGFDASIRKQICEVVLRVRLVTPFFLGVAGNGCAVFAFRAVQIAQLRCSSAEIVVEVSKSRSDAPRRFVLPGCILILTAQCQLFSPIGVVQCFFRERLQSEHSLDCKGKVVVVPVRRLQFERLLERGLCFAEVAEARLRLSKGRSLLRAHAALLESCPL